MQHRNFPARRSDSILLYGFGLALVLSLVFNGFLLYKQGRQPGIYDYELGSSTYPVDNTAWQRQLSDCKQANQQKDSLLRRLEQVPNIPSGPAPTVEHTASNY